MGAERGAPEPLLPWALGTLHAAMLMALLVTLGHERGVLGNLLSTLGTLPGLALFAWLWLLSWWGARGVLRGVTLERPLRAFAGDAIGHAMIWGGGVGAAFLGGVLLTLLAANAAELASSATALFGLLFFAAFALAGACVVGLFVGGLFAALDLLLLAAARRLRG